ncbi:MAG: CsgG/HfaB family protein [Candidatus Omnitrophota bacterium]
MKAALKNASVATVAVMLIGSFMAGCASMPIVEPTAQEAAAARQYKKTVAIVGLSESGSSIEGVGQLVLGRIEHLLVGRFNLVERGNMNAILAEKGITGPVDVTNAPEVGKILGADYLVFAGVSASIAGPRLGSSRSRKGGDKFFGYLWDEYCCESEVSLKIVEVASGAIIYSDAKKGLSTSQSNQENFKEEGLFEKAYRRRSTATQILRIAGALGKLSNEYSMMVSQSIEQAVNGFTYDMKNKFAQSGEILQILSEQDVMINIGSAFGIRNGDTLIVWAEGAPIQDPRTNLVTVPKTQRGTLKVIQVNSGLTCIARGSKNTISQLRVGDKVSTH